MRYPLESLVSAKDPQYPLAAAAEGVSRQCPSLVQVIHMDLPRRLLSAVQIATICLPTALAVGELFRASPIPGLSSSLPGARTSKREAHGR